MVTDDSSTALPEDTYKTAELIRTCCPAVEIREVQLKAQMWRTDISHYRWGDPGSFESLTATQFIECVEYMVIIT